jgi:hypothetical protein
MKLTSFLMAQRMPMRDVRRQNLPIAGDGRVVLGREQRMEGIARQLELGRLGDKNKKLL